MKPLSWHTEKRRINDLVPYSKNPRTMSDKQLGDLKRSIKKFNIVEVPAIDKDLFDKVQEKMMSYASRNETKEFAFTKLMTCGLCGSGITADEKFKKQQDGTTHRYVYYGCCRYQDKNCKSGYIREEDLIEQLANLMDKIDLDEIGMKERIKAEIERHKKFQSGLLGVKGSAVKVGDIDIRNYAKYILRDGTIFEKRELLSCLRSRITMAKKEIRIA